MRNKVFEPRNMPMYFRILISLYLIFFSSLTFAAEMKVYTVEEWQKLRKQEYLDADLVIVGQVLSCTTRTIKTHDMTPGDGNVYHYTTYTDNYRIKTLYALKGNLPDSMLNVQSDSYTQCFVTFPPTLIIDEKGDSSFIGKAIPIGETQHKRISKQGMSIILLQKKDTTYVLTYVTNYTKKELDFYQSIKKEVPKIQANRQAVNSSSDTLPIINDSGYVYQGKWPDDWSYSWQLMSLHLAKSKQEYLIVPVNANLEIIQFQGDSWQHIGRIQYANNRVSYEYNLWTTGDIDNDGNDEIITCYDSLVSCYKWNGQDFIIQTAIFRYCVEQVRVGDINNDGNNELVFLGGDSLPKDVIGYPYHLCIANWDTLGLHLLWDDSTKLGYGVRNMPDFLLPIADVTNVGYNLLLISRSQSDVSPTEYNLLEWNDKTNQLELVKSFRITDRLVPGDTQILSLPFISGVLNCATKNDLTYLSGAFARKDEKYMLTGHVVLQIKNDSLVQMRPISEEHVQGCFINIDGNGVGLLVLWRDLPSTQRRFRFFRL